MDSDILILDQLEREKQRSTILERTIERIQIDHAKVLQGLYQEIDRLTQMMIDTQFIKAKEEQPIEIVKEDKEVQVSTDALDAELQTDTIEPEVCEKCLERSMLIYEDKQVQTQLPAASRGKAKFVINTGIESHYVKKPEQLTSSGPLSTVPASAHPGMPAKVLSNVFTMELQKIGVVSASDGKLLQELPKDTLVLPPPVTNPEPIAPAEQPQEQPPTECQEMLFHQDASLFFLIQKEKAKYKDLVKRNAEDKKRKQLHIDKLLAEIQLYKNVFTMAGVSCDPDSLQRLIDRKNGAPCTPIKILTRSDLNPKMNVLPPITVKTDETIADLEGHDDKDGHKHDADDRNSEITAIAPTLNGAMSVINARRQSKRKDTMEEQSVKQSTPPDSIPAILLHNQNLDYNNRTKYYLGNILYEPTSPQQELVVDTLPPLPEKVLLSPETIKTNGIAKSQYAIRVWRAKRIREKQQQDLRDKI